MKCSLITYHLSTAQTQTYPTTGAEEWRCYRSVDPCSSSAIRLPCNPPGEDKHIKKIGMRHFLQPSIQHHLAQSRKVSPRFAQQPLPNHYWTYHLSRHTYEFPAPTKSCMLCSVTKGNGFAMPVCTIQSVTQKNSCISIFGDEVLIPLSSTSSLTKSYRTNLNGCQSDMPWTINIDKITGKLGLLRPCELLCNGTLSWNLLMFLIGNHFGK